MNSSNSDNNKCEATMDNFYKYVIEDVIENSLENFHTDRIDMEVLEELKQVWLLKVQEAINQAKRPETNQNPTIPAENSTIIPILMKITGNPPFEIVVNLSQEQLKTNIIARLLTPERLSDLMKMTPEAAAITMQSLIDHEPQVQAQVQVDGNDEKTDDDSDDNDDKDEIKMEIKEEDGLYEPDPDSNDDMTDDEKQEEDTENLIVCQHLHVKHQKNHWRFHLINGIMQFNGIEYLFNRAIGEGTW